MDFGLNHIKMLMFYVLLIDPLPRRLKNWIHINSIEISIQQKNEINVKGMKNYTCALFNMEEKTAECGHIIIEL